MNSDEYEQATQELIYLKRRLQHLKIQEARYGIDVSPHISSEIEDLARKICDKEDSITHPTTPSPLRSCHVNMFSYPRGNKRGEAHEIIDADWEFIDLSNYSSAQQPSTDEWNNILQRMHSFATGCRKSNIIGLIYATHPCAVAFGKQFAGAPVELWINGNTGRDVIWWNTGAPVNILSFPEVEYSPLQQGSDIVIQVCATNQQSSIDNDVKATIERYNISVRQFVSIHLPKEDTKVRGPGHAMAIATTVGDVIRKSAGYPIHLFLATPVAVAVFIGFKTNACPPFLCYEHVKTRIHDTEAPCYVPACLLS